MAACSREQSRAATITDFVVRTLHSYTGRGSTKARTYLNEDLVTVVLHNSFTKAEHSLIRSGRADLVLTMRREFQDTMRVDLIAGLEAILDRKVAAFMSDNHIDPDISVETFVLEERPRPPSG